MDLVTFYGKSSRETDMFELQINVYFTLSPILPHAAQITEPTHRKLKIFQG